MPVEATIIDRRCPRACGDGPTRSRMPLSLRKVVPAHAGMDRAGFSMQSVEAAVVPAHAGMDRRPSRRAGG